jgi:hypothetical protein
MRNSYKIHKEKEYNIIYFSRIIYRGSPLNLTNFKSSHVNVFDTFIKYI